MSVANVPQLFTERFRVNQDDLTKALQFQTRNGGQLEQILVRMGALSSEYLPAYYAEVYDLQQLDDDQQQALLDDDKHWAQLYESLPAELASRCVAHQCVPIGYAAEPQTLKVVCTNPSQ